MSNGSTAPLTYHAQVLDEACLAPSRRYAVAEGSVLDGQGVTLLCWGAGTRIELRAGTGDPLGLAAAQAQLDSAEPLELGSRAHTLPELRPVALGALGFDPDRASSLLVPRIAVLRDGPGPLVGIVTGSLEEISAARACFPFTRGAPPPLPEPAGLAPDRFELESTRGHEHFLELVGRATSAIEAGKLDKVVLAREVRVMANRPLVLGDLLVRLRALYPTCLTFSIDGFVGASPELLVRRKGAEAVAVPLAGTVARSDDPGEDKRLSRLLLSSKKDLAEHGFVVSAVRETLARYSVAALDPPSPHLLHLSNVSHLATTLRTRLVDPAPSVLELVGALHPTPAVAGSPREAAVQFLAAHEDLDRDRYAGPVGYLRAGGDGAFWLGIRSAFVEGASARLVAGVGVVAGSEPLEELAETQLKLQALLGVVVRP